MSSEKKQLKFLLKANDDTEVTVEEDVAFQSNLLKKMAEDLGIEDPESLLLEALPVSNVDGWTLLKIVDWCTTHRGEVFKPKDENEDQRITLTQADEEYLSMTNTQLLDVLLGANYLDVQGLIEIITQKIANMAIGKTVEELRELYGLENDFTEEEAEEVRKTFEWVDSSCG